MSRIYSFFPHYGNDLLSTLLTSCKKNKINLQVLYKRMQVTTCWGNLVTKWSCMPKKGGYIAKHESRQTEITYIQTQQSTWKENWRPAMRHLFTKLTKFNVAKI